MDIVLKVSLFSVMITAGFMLIGLLLWFRTKRLIQRAHKARGVVLKIKTVRYENRDTFTPVVRFATSDGRALSFTDPISSYPPEFEIGEQVDVLYDPQDPHKARAVKKVSDLFLPARLFRIASMASLAAGFLVSLALMLMNFVLSVF